MAYFDNPSATYIEQCKSMSQPPFSQMPLHLISLVLSELDSMQALGSAILSHSSMYAAFEEKPNTIMSRILRNQIPSNLMVYAANTYDAAQEHYENRPLGKLMDRFSDRSVSDADFQNWYLWWRLEHHNSGPAFAASLSKTHTLIEYFTDRYLSDAIPLAAQELFAPSQVITTELPSKDDIYRIRRAFYRFQFHCNMTCDEDNMPGGRGWLDEPYRTSRGRKFMLRFPPWVNEQLACIHDYLESILSKAFDDVAAHDVGWGAESVDWVCQGESNIYKKAYLSYGLHFLFQLDRANTYDERLRLLTSKGLPYTAHGLSSDLLENRAPRDYLHYQWAERLGQLSTAQLDEIIKNTDGPDGYDSSPFRTWRYMHKRRKLRDTVFVADHCRLRLCGYVFWDALGPELKNKAFRQRLQDAKWKGRADYAEPEGFREEMVRSWAERAEIRNRGGHGYWTRGDLSKIEWEPSSV